MDAYFQAFGFWFHIIAGSVFAVFLVGFGALFAINEIVKATGTLKVIMQWKLDQMKKERDFHGA